MTMRLAAAAFAAAAIFAAPAAALDYAETPLLAPRVAQGELPPVAERLPKSPLVADIAARGRELGKPGGEIVSLVARARDIRYLSANTYGRLIGYTQDLKLAPDLLEDVQVEGNRIFTFRLRDGHRWSDGAPFTAEDFRFYWEDVANNRELSPAGLPDFLVVDGSGPRFEVIDARTVRYSWDAPNPRFLPTLAQPRDPFIYRPAHYLKRFHADYADQAKLEEAARKGKLKSWAGLFNRMDDMFESSNPELPTLQAWKVATAAPATRFIFERNPFYHRVDEAGQQLPYLDRVVLDVAAGGLMAAKANSGDADLLFRGLTMGDIPILKEGERAKGFRTLMWPYARGSEIALYPNLTVTDPVWRALNRDLRFRRALSLGIDRRTLNNSLLFGLGREGNNTVASESPLFEERLRTLNAGYDPAEASRLLDEIGLTKRNAAGIRLLPDGRELEIIVETDGESGLIVDGLTLIGEFWREIGVRLFVKPQDRTVLRNRTYAGLTTMVAAQGLDLALATAAMPPAELAPLRQDYYSWAKWGQYRETRGTSGEPCDMPEAKRLLDLYAEWASASDAETQTRIWREMLTNHAENQWSIGTVAGALQPVVARNGLRNVPARAVYSWEPTSMLGVYRMDEFYWDRVPGREARRGGAVATGSTAQAFERAGAR
ncbi:ABC transporter substrate-binding protein [Enterovirga aerilata]|uniref:ABC transporter substrate-binding protein n=1 Tax=Enterovirga aerilata TaxID=2730920 RepID=A0A849IBV8_9HYPH|nr:ABC transporter substrate-binding protein [Enterovirga sp. DB1703]NNM74888.1 ABC transporter substrate-binding protein [Enterovirga sp. DB1703]